MFQLFLDRMKASRKLSFIAIVIVYLISAAVGLLVFISFSSFPLLIRLGIADFFGTLLVWAAGVLLKNSSVYDPYWSVAPIVIIPFTAQYLNKSFFDCWPLLAIILIWGIRLTLNWAANFKNLNFQDWRYSQLKEQSPGYWFAVNLFGIHIFPTIVVFLVMIPAFVFLLSISSYNFFTYFGALVSLLAVLLQGVSDHQMHKFRKNPKNSGKVNNTGIWEYIRHPNYLGEILMWWGVYFMMISVNRSYWPAFIGPLLNTLMFITVSIPLMENRQLHNKPNYSEYCEKTGKLLPRLFG